MMSQIDHLVLTTRSIKQCREFYSKVLGMKVETFTEGRQLYYLDNENQFT